MGRAAERQQGRGIGGPGCEHARGRVRIARRHELARRAGHHEIRDAADARREHRKAGGHRLENRVRQALPVGDQRERVAVGEPLRDVAAMAEQRHAIAQAERIAMPLDLLAVGAVAEHAQLPGLAARLGERVQQRDQVLGRRESRRAAEHEAAAGWAVRRQRGGRVDAVVDDVQAAARRDAALARELQVVARDADDRIGQGRNRLLAGRVDGARGRRRDPRTPSHAR